MIDRLLGYSRKLHILRQIMSNKARIFGRINTATNIATVFVSSFLTFVGFAGEDKIASYVNWFTQVSKEQVTFAFNIFVFGLFVLLILHLVFRFSERHAEASRAIVSLTHLLNGIDDMVARAEQGYQVTSADIDIVRQKYDTLIQVIPPNSDAEYLRAKRDFGEKAEKKIALQLVAHQLFDAASHQRAVEALIRGTPIILRSLEILRDVDRRLYVAGGVIRNAVWDYLHAYTSVTAPDDVDVVYFDQNCAQKIHDELLEQKLADVAPNIRWSVKNQARMHVANGEQPYQSVEDAVSRWPETATAIAARLQPDGSIEIIAPYGFSDLFRMIVQPTTHFKGKIDKYRERLDRKRWEVHWPRLKFLDRD